MNDRQRDVPNTEPLFLTNANRKYVVSREMLTNEEYEALMTWHLAVMPAGYFVMKVPNAAPLFCDAPSWPLIEVSEEKRAAGEQHVFVDGDVQSSSNALLAELARLEALLTTVLARRRETSERCRNCGAYLNPDLCAYCGSFKGQVHSCTGPSLLNRCE